MWQEAIQVNPAILDLGDVTHFHSFKEQQIMPFNLEGMMLKEWCWLIIGAKSSK